MFSSVQAVISSNTSVWRIVLWNWFIQQSHDVMVMHTPPTTLVTHGSPMAVSQCATTLVRSFSLSQVETTKESRQVILGKNRSQSTRFILTAEPIRPKTTACQTPVEETQPRVVSLSQVKMVRSVSSKSLTKIRNGHTSGLKARTWHRPPSMRKTTRCSSRTSCTTRSTRLCSHPRKTQSCSRHDQIRSSRCPSTWRDQTKSKGMNTWSHPSILRPSMGLMSVWRSLL